MTRILLAALGAVLLSLAPARAEDKTPPKMDWRTNLEFSGTLSVVWTGLPGAMTQPQTWKIWHQKGLERRDTTLAGSHQIHIFRPDLNKLWVINADTNAATEMPIQVDQLSAFWNQLTQVDPAARGVAPAGSEKVNGVATTLYRIQNTDKKGNPFTISYWHTPEGLNARIRYEGSRDGQAMTMNMEYADLKFGTQPDSLFAQPANLTESPYAKALEQRKAAMQQAIQNMTPEQRQRYEMMQKMQSMSPEERQAYIKQMQQQQGK